MQDLSQSCVTLTCQLALAGEAGGWNGGVDGVVLAGFAWHRVSQPLQRVRGAAVVVTLLARRLPGNAGGSPTPPLGRRSDGGCGLSHVNGLGPVAVMISYASN